MSGRYMKILVSVIVVLAVSFSLPNVYAEHPCDGLDCHTPLPPTCVVFDSTAMRLSSTTDSITVTWLDNLGVCDANSGTPITFNLLLKGVSDSAVIDVNSGYTFTNLDSNTEYVVLLDVKGEDIVDGELFAIGSISKPVRTQAELDVPVDCVNLDDLNMTLSSTADSITVNFLDESICNVPDGVTFFYSIGVQAVLFDDEQFVRPVSNGFTFENLQHDDAEYKITLHRIQYLDPSTSQLVLVRVLISETIYTKAEPVVDCVNVDDFYLILSSTSDTITADWLSTPICDAPYGATILENITLVQNGIVLYHERVVDTGFIFEDLEFDTEYTVILEVYSDYNDIPLGTVTKTIDTKDQFYNVPEVGPILEALEEPAAGCSGDCTPPTIGLDENNVRLVDSGFSYNNNPVDVIAWHTPYPLITAIVNQTNTVEIIAYDNGGIFNLDMIQFGLGLEELGQPLHDVEVLIEVHLEAFYSENKVIVEKVVIRDRDNLIDTFSVFAVTEPVDCIDDELDEECLKVTLEYSYREATINNMMAVNVVDRSLNTQNFYLNDGVEVIGESMNPTPFVILPNKQTSQQTENLTKALFRTDKVNDIWMDGEGVEYLKTGDNNFDRITPAESYTCNDPPLSEINVPTRSNCHFRALTAIWDN